MIEIFDDRVEISNPGGLPSGLDPKDFGKKSVVRNPVIADLLHRADYIEKLGTGINRIKNAVKEHGKLSVEFSFSTFFTVVFILSGDLKVTENQSKILKSINENPNITTKELSKIIGISDRKIKENIKKLKNAGFLLRIGPAKGGYWKILK